MSKLRRRSTKKEKNQKKETGVILPVDIRYKFVKISKERSERNFFDKGIRKNFNMQMFPMENK
jgi:hypothetical protein